MRRLKPLSNVKVVLILSSNSWQENKISNYDCMTSPQKKAFLRFCGSPYNVGLHQIGGLCGQSLLLLDVVSHIAEFLLQHLHCLEVSRVVEGVTAEEQELKARR